jgi:hypothetical protein
MEVYINTLPDMRKELEWGKSWSGTERFGLLHNYSPLFSSSPLVGLLSRQMMPVQIWQSLLNTFYVLDHKLPTQMTSETGQVLCMHSWLVGLAPCTGRSCLNPGPCYCVGTQAQRAKSSDFSRLEEIWVLCEISQFLMLARPITFFKKSLGTKHNMLLC